MESKNSSDFAPKSAKWFESDIDANEIRNIGARIVSIYHRLGQAGDEAIGMVSQSEIQQIKKELQSAFHDLEEFGVQPSMHVGQEPESFTKNPLKMAQWVGGQLLNLKKLPLTTDMERNNAISGMGLSNLDAADPHQNWPTEVQNMRKQVAAIAIAKTYLKLDE